MVICLLPISFTIEILTASSSNVAFIYLTMTAHWLSNEFSQQRAVLRVMYFPESHTVTHKISEYLNKSLVSFKIQHIKIVL